MDQQQSATLHDADDEDSTSMFEGGSQAEASDDALTLSSHSDHRHRPEDAELPQEELVAPVVSLLKRSVSLDYENRNFGDDDSEDVDLEGGRAPPPPAPDTEEPSLSGEADGDKDDYIVPLKQMC